jgi:hypothetical protein
MFVESEGHGSEGVSSELNTGELYGEGGDEYDEEERVVEEVLKDIDFR